MYRVSTVIKRIHGPDEILGVLAKFDQAFPRSMSSRLGALDEHAKKLADRAFVYVAESDGAMAGFMAFYANDVVSSTGYLTHIAVDGSFRGSGIGLLLMRRCMQVSKEAGMKRIKLEVDTDNATAIAFYASLGFVVCGPASPESCYMLLERL